MRKPQLTTRAQPQARYPNWGEGNTHAQTHVQPPMLNTPALLHRNKRCCVQPSSNRWMMQLTHTISSSEHIAKVAGVAKADGCQKKQDRILALLPTRRSPDACCQSWRARAPAPRGSMGPSSHLHLFLSTLPGFCSTLSPQFDGLVRPDSGHCAPGPHCRGPSRAIFANA